MDNNGRRCQDSATAIIYLKRDWFKMCAGDVIGTLVGLRNSFIGGNRLCMSFNRFLFV